jgi:putative tryptophan/tyrosine transport system substrate-binding protein
MGSDIVPRIAAGMIPLGVGHMAIGIGRRQFISALGSAAVARPLEARAQQQAMPVIGFLSSNSPEPFTKQVAAFRRGLNEIGFTEGQNVAIEYRWAEGQYDQLPALASDLVRRQVAAIAAGGPPAARAAKAATTTIPIVFLVGGDPVKSGLVASLSRPGGNVTGVALLINELAPKQLEVLRELIPKATSIGALVNPDNPATETDMKELQGAARAMGLELFILDAKAESDIDAAFATLVQKQAGGLVVVSDPYMFDRRAYIAALATRHALPTIYPLRDFAAAGGLMSYGSSLTDAYRLQGVFVGQILKGATPADLPAQESTKVELVINLKTAKALGLTVPLTLLGRADEVIE